MQRLAKVGFSQSYTYFTWRNAKQELMEYLTELTTPPLAEYFRPNFWPNTPDILHEVLQVGGLPIFAARVVLAATLSGNFGVYGPAFELGENVPIEPGSEEYLNSEKYQQRTWDLDRPESLAPLLTALNAARHAHPALQRLAGLRFHPIDNDQLIAYTKQSDDQSDLVLRRRQPRPAPRAVGHARTRSRRARTRRIPAAGAARRADRRGAACGTAAGRHSRSRPAPAGRGVRRPTGGSHRTAVRDVPMTDAPAEAPWYKDAIIYELHVRSFFDGNGDGSATSAA